MSSNTQKCLHLFGSWNVLAEELVRLAREANWKVFYRTSERLKPSEEILKTIAHFAVANELDEVMKLGPSPQKGDVSISLGAPWIFKRPWLDLWNGLAFNFHCRPLPWHRGAGGASWLILMREQIGAATVHRISDGIDSGEICAQKTFLYPESCILPEDFDAVDSEQSRHLAQEWLLPLLKQGADKLTPLPTLDFEGEGSYWPRLSTAHHGWIDWDWSASEIESFCRAFGGMYGGARTFFEGQEVVMKGVRLGPPKSYHPFQRGLIFFKTSQGYYIAAKEGAIIVQEIRSLQSQEVLKVNCGYRLVTPREKLEKSLRSRVQYLPDGRVHMIEK